MLRSRELAQTLPNLPWCESTTRCKKTQLDAFLVGAVHDEIIVECDADCAEAVGRVVKREMVAAGTTFLKSCPIEVEVHIGTSWAH